MGWSHWSSAETSRLKRLVREGKSDTDISNELNRPVQGVKSKRIELGFNRRKMPKRLMAPSTSASLVSYRIKIEGPGIDMSVDTDKDTAFALLQLALGGNK